MGDLIIVIFTIIIIAIFIKEKKSGAYDDYPFGPWNWN